MIADILLEVVLPIFVLIGFGVIMQYAFKLDLYTLAKINFYYITPAAVFMSMYESEMSPQLLGTVSLFYFLYILILYGISSLIAWRKKYSRGMKAAFTNSLILDNSGNYGLPVNALAFKGDPLAGSVQALIMSFQSLLTFTYGVISIQGAKSNGLYKQAFIGFLKMPVPYALVLGLLLHALALPLPVFISQPLVYAHQSMVAIALLTLGAQIIKYPLRLNRLDVYLSVLLRLLVAPAVGITIVLLLDMKGIAAQALIIASGMPVGVNSSILAEEYQNEPDFAAQTVLISTILNIITITALISLAQYIA
ncbi:MULTISPECIES: AEC family transporter [Paenibacillus]|uniref:AEC family transporter n=1 Tax=Paenibacillus campinasensis TaxID=66347 RepID=A0A268EDR8_9BACL|nr:MULTISPECIES: AEC family transporter [Paenibacillus]MUG67912.1 AEC family transporter [Paenibacillus campinasensis]PAD71261.1 permease [Paenibacillus campinasensis]PAK49697.1 permease [Paenibacillus sp. 7541]